MPLLPVARPLILCQDVLAPASGGTNHFIHVCDAFRPQGGYPYQRPEFCVVVQLADGTGNVPTVVRIVEADSQAEIFRTTDHVIRFPNRHTSVRAVFRLRNCVFPRPGLYWVELLCHGQFMTDQVLHLMNGEAES